MGTVEATKTDETATDSSRTRDALSVTDRRTGKSYELPIVSTSMVPPVPGTIDHHPVLVRGFVLWFEHSGVGSVDSVVAPELSTALVTGVLAKAIAPAKLSFGGGEPVTVSVCAEVLPGNIVTPKADPFKSI
jgi:hypothetical protein